MTESLQADCICTALNIGYIFIVKDCHLLNSQKSAIQYRFGKLAHPTQTRQTSVSLN